MHRIPISRPSPEDALIFIHIPKTAGSTLHRIIYRQYKAGELYHTDRQRDGWQRFTQWPQAQRARIRLLMGHIEMDAQDYLPRRAHFFTMLRDPVRRARSYFDHVRRIPEHYCHDLVYHSHMDIAQFAQSQADVMMDNGQTRMLAGVLYKVPYGQLSEAHLAQAKANLDKCLVVGLTEQFDQSLLLMRRVFGWRRLYYARRNVGQAAETRTPARERVDDTFAALEEVNRFDRALYRYAQERMAQQWAQLGNPTELARFQRMNRLLEPLLYYGGEIKARLGETLGSGNRRQTDGVIADG